MSDTSVKDANWIELLLTVSLTDNILPLISWYWTSWFVKLLGLNKSSNFGLRYFAIYILIINIFNLTIS